jgi:hypothetical protein
MINETIFHGLIEALSRGESLQNAMFSFFNAGYSKKEIEDAARELYKQTGGQAEKIINPKKPLQGAETLKVNKEVQEKSSEYSEKPVVPENYLNPQISVEQEIKPEDKKEIKKEIEKEEKKGFMSRLKSKFKSKPKPEPVKEIKKPEPIKEIKKPEPKPEPVKEIKKPEPKPEQKPEIKKVETSPVRIVSNYREPDESVEELNNRIESAISTLRNVRLPSKIEIINLEAERRPNSVVQRVSDYGYNTPKNQAGQGIIILLIFLFVFFLGALISVFVFKDKLIELFNAWNLA